MRCAGIRLGAAFQNGVFAYVQGLAGLLVRAACLLEFFTLRAMCRRRGCLVVCLGLSLLLLLDVLGCGGGMLRCCVLGNGSISGSSDRIVNAPRRNN